MDVREDTDIVKFSYHSGCHVRNPGAGAYRRKKNLYTKTTKYVCVHVCGESMFCPFFSILFSSYHKTNIHSRLRAYIHTPAGPAKAKQRERVICASKRIYTSLCFFFWYLYLQYFLGGEENGGIYILKNIFYMYYSGFFCGVLYMSKVFVVYQEKKSRKST